MTTTRPIADGLFTWPDEPRLVGGSCRTCRTTTFPRQASCPRCTGSDIEDAPLARRGVLWSWTVQGFEPKRPYRADGPFEPYGVGSVELEADGPGSSVLVESRLTESDPDHLRIGDEMDLVILPICHDETGDELVTFAFAPARART